MFRVISRSIKTIEELVGVLSRINNDKSFSALLDNEPVAEDMSYSELPPHLEFASIKDVKINNLRLTGELRPVDWQSIKEVFLALDDTIGRKGRLSIDIRYEERDDELSNDGYEYARIISEYGKYYFSYSAGGTRMSMDREYAVNVFENMIAVLDLPIIIKNEADHFTLIHKNNGVLELSDSFLGRNPATFSCELTDIDAYGLIEKLNVFEEKFIYGAILGVDWTAGHSSRNDGAKPGTAKVVDLYNSVITARPPATRYSMRPGFDVSGLDGLKTLHHLCSGNNMIKARYGVINFGSVKAMLTISINSEGYFIEAATKDKSAVDKLSEALNMSFRNN